MTAREHRAVIFEYADQNLSIHTPHVREGVY